MPVSLIGTFGVMYLLGYSLDNLSLMALTIATGFVVDDAIVVIENITRHLEAGHGAAARRRCAGAREIGFTVLSISVSLVAVFIPILLMGGIVGRLFREFAVTLSVAIAVSLVVSLTHDADDVRAPAASRATSSGTAGSTARASACSTGCCAATSAALALGAAPSRRSMLLVTAGHDRRSTSTSTSIVPKGFFPQQDTGRLIGIIRGRRRTSRSRRCSAKLADVRRDRAEPIPAVDNVIAFTGGGGGTTQHAARMFVALKPLERAQGLAPIRSSPACARKLAQRPGRHAVPAGGAGRPRRRPRRATPVPVHAAGRRPRRAATPGRRACSSALRDAAASSRREHRSAEPRACRRRSSIDRDTASRLGHHAAADRRHALRRLRPAPGRRPSTRRSTSTTWCMEVDAASSGRAPRRCSDIYVRSPTARQVPLERVRALRADARRRSRSTTRGSSRRSRSRSTWRRASRWATRSTAIERRRARDRPAGDASTAASRARRRPSRPRSRTSRC